MKAVSRLTSFAGYSAKALFRGAGMALSLTVLFIGSDCFGRGMGTNELRRWGGNGASGDGFGGGKGSLKQREV